MSGRIAIERAMLGEIPSLSSHNRSEVLKYLEVMCDEAEAAELNLIAFKNGIYDIDSDRLIPFDPNIIITNMIPWNYNRDAKSNLVDKVFYDISCGDENIRYLLEEAAGSCFYRSNKIGGGKTFVLTGGKNNGKSTYLDMVKCMIGKGNYSSLDLMELSDRFRTAEMFGKLANIGDDISSDYLQGKQLSIFKKIVTGESITIERKGQDPFDFDPVQKQFFSANDIPRMKDHTGAVLRRLLIIPFNATFDKSDPDYDPNIGNKLNQAEHMEYFIQCALESL